MRVIASRFSRRAFLLRILDRPDRADAYIEAARDPAVVLDEGIRGDLLVRWVLMTDAAPAIVGRLQRYRAFYKTRHLVALMTAIRSRGLSFADFTYYFERRIAHGPSLGADARRAAVRNLLAADEPPASGARIMVAAMPKSASTFLCTLLADLVGAPMTSPHNINDPVGTAFDQLDFMRAYSLGGVVHSHLDAGIRTLAMVRLLDLRPVVQTRNVFDALASYLDHSQARIYPGSRFAGLSPEQRRRVGILRIARHYVDMVASWSVVPAGVPVLWVTYDDVRRDPGAVARRVLAHVGLPIDDTRIEAAVRAADPAALPEAERAQRRINTAVRERGRIFTEDEKSWVRTLYAEYPGVDFAVIDPEWS